MAALRDTLLPAQRLALPGVEYLHRPARSAGRSYLLAVSALLEAMRVPAAPVCLFDHTVRGRAALEIAMRLAERFADDDGRFEFNRAGMTVRYFPGASMRG
jgi:hypothetical protein